MHAYASVMLCISDVECKRASADTLLTTQPLIQQKLQFTSYDNLYTSAMGAFALAGS